MARTKGAVDRTNPENMKQLEAKKEEIRKKCEVDIAVIDAKIKAAHDKRVGKIAEKIAKSGKTDKEIDDFFFHD